MKLNHSIYIFKYMRKKLDLQNIVYQEGRFFVAQALAVEVSSFGKTRKEAVKNLKEALELYFEEEKTPKISKVVKPEIVKMSLKYA